MYLVKKEKNSFVTLFILLLFACQSADKPSNYYPYGTDKRVNVTRPVEIHEPCEILLNLEPMYKKYKTPKNTYVIISKHYIVEYFPDSHVFTIFDRKRKAHLSGLDFCESISSKVMNVFYFHFPELSQDDEKPQTKNS